VFACGDLKLKSRLLLGTAQYPSPAVLKDAIDASGTQLITVSLRRESANNNEQNSFYDFLKTTSSHFLPNTAGCRTAQQAITTAQMAREIFKTNRIKLEVIGDAYNLQPDPIELIKATESLLKLGFEVFPYCTDDLVICQRLYDLGCKVLMPWAAPIGTGQGLLNPYALTTIRERLPDATLIVDAGIGAPSHAALAMELGFDAVLINSAVALADDPIKMAEAFKYSVQAGHLAYSSGLMPERQTAIPSTPLIDTPFWQQSD